jgi:hypothetical protein
VSGLSGTIDIHADQDSVVVVASALVDSVQKVDLFTQPIVDTRTVLSVHLLRLSKGGGSSDWRGHLDLWADIPGLGTHVRASSQMNRVLGAGGISADAQVSFASPDTVRLPRNMWATGSMDASIRAKLEEEGVAKLSCLVGLDGLCVGIEPTLAVEGIRGRIPFTQSLNLRQRALVPTPAVRQIQAAGPGDVSYGLWQSHRAKGSRVHVDRITVLDYAVSDVEVDLAYQDGALDVPRFVLNAYDGNVAGHARLDLGTGDPEGIAYQVKAQLAGINSAKLPRVRRRGGEGSELCANLEFVGKGVDPKRRFDIEGGLHITRIERRVAENLLMLMDPKETDKSIQNMRRLMRQGWGLKTFSFAAKNGFVYPSIVPVKPWYAPFSLPKSLEFPRMPLKFFLGYLALR